MKAMNKVVAYLGTLGLGLSSEQQAEVEARFYGFDSAKAYADFGSKAGYCFAYHGDLADFDTLRHFSGEKTRKNAALLEGPKDDVLLYAQQEAQNSGSLIVVYDGNGNHVQTFDQPLTELALYRSCYYPKNPTAEMRYDLETDDSILDAHLRTWTAVGRSIALSKQQFKDDQVPVGETMLFVTVDAEPFANQKVLWRDTV